ncbi:PLP-dependent aminotransferase family protein [Terasakiella sp. SH-1]|uniref:MocR-like pyridoxine biosynthesis transcription factor PdxR n=1 Tax=Terasakiella sp. SH-1 TaxID=2560057 RepID=UPI0010738A97|nr:PLP-dependent aminotransferase family protein [Terasakiella sp. SH-1]
MNDLQLATVQTRWKEGFHGPKFRRLYMILRDYILSGGLAPGTVLLPSRRLAAVLALSRNTVNQAYELLHSEGFVETRAGAGVYVTHDLPQKGWSNKAVSQNYGEDLPALARRAEEWLHVHKRHQQGDKDRAFSSGRPALDDFPFDQWARLLSRRWRLCGETLAISETVAGYQPLREHVCEYLQTTRGLNCTPDQVIILSGAQQGLDLIARVLWEKGDRIVVEDPAYPGMDGVIRGIGAIAVPTEVDDEGLCLDKVRCADVKSFMVTPSRNYPLGTTMSLARRLGLLEEARRCNAWVIEDDFDGEFRFDGPPLSSLQGLDREGRVLYVGTFSRIIFPALRLGYLVVPPNLLEPFLAAKSYSDGHTSILHQAALADFFQEGYFSSHLRRMKKLYQERRRYLIERLEQDFSSVLNVLPADGGLHVCTVFKQSVCDVQLCQKLSESGVSVVPLSPFYRRGKPQQGMIMGFAGYNQQKMDVAFSIMQKYWYK